MTNWGEVLQRHYDWAHKDNGFRILVGCAAQDSDLADLVGRTGFPVTAEFTELYRQADGFGVAVPGDEDCWLLVPTSRIDSTIQAAREWFEETHPGLASRFFPFIDWSSGDYTGYLLDSDGAALPGLYEFDHESYEFEEAQPPEEILRFCEPSILELLNRRS